MPTAAELNDRFAIASVLRFDEDRNGLPRAQVSTPTGDATVYLQGAHMTFWQPMGYDPVLYSGCDARFLQEHTSHVGVPVLFPWFGAKTVGPRPELNAGAPMHGFARQQSWTLEFAALAGNDVHLTFTLGPSELSRSFGYGDFRLACVYKIGAALTVELTVANDAAEPLVFEEALHTYLAVKDVRDVCIEGLAHTEYLDKVAGFERKRQEEKFLRFAQRVDRVYLNTSARAVLHDPIAKRLLTVDKSGSHTTVVWNPWSELAAQYNDIGSEGWPRFACIETVNAAENAVTLLSGQTHTMRATVRVERMGYR